MMQAKIKISQQLVMPNLPSELINGLKTAVNEYLILAGGEKKLSQNRFCQELAEFTHRDIQKKHPNLDSKVIAEIVIASCLKKSKLQKFLENNDNSLTYAHLNTLANFLGITYEITNHDPAEEYFYVNGTKG